MFQSPLDSLDALLAQDLIKPPPDFTQTVMQSLQTQPLPQRKVPNWVQWLALAGSVALGAEQLVHFMLGIWLVSSSV